MALIICAARLTVALFVSAVHLATILSKIGGLLITGDAITSAPIIIVVHRSVVDFARAELAFDETVAALGAIVVNLGTARAGTLLIEFACDAVASVDRAMRVA